MPRVSRKKWVFCILICFVLLIAMYIAFRHNDYHSLSGLETWMAVSPELSQYLEEHPEYSLEDVEAGKSTFEGVRYQSYVFKLYDTAYTIIYQYEATGTTAGEIFICDSELVNEDNTDYMILESDTLPIVAENHVSLSFDNETERSKAMIRIWMPQDAAFTSKDVFVQSQQPYFTDGLVKVLFVALVGCILVYVCLNASSEKRKVKTKVMFGACVLFAMASALPYFCTGLAKGHDLFFHLSRIEGLRMSLQEGIFPIQMNPYAFEQYGYPDAVFYPYLFLVFPAILRCLQVSPLLSYKALMIAISIGTACISAFVGVRMTKSRKMGLLFSVFCIFATYRLTNVYVRDAVGEVLAMSFLPLALYGIHGLFHGDKRAWKSLAVAMIGIINSHVLSVLLMSLFLVGYCLCHVRTFFTKPVMMDLAKAVLLTVGLCAWWITPFLGWSTYGITDIGSNLESEAAHLSQMFHQFTFYPDAISKSVTVGTQGEMPLTIGILPLLGSVLYGLVRFWLAKDWFEKNKSLRVLGDFSLGAFVASVFIASTSFPYYIVAQISFLSFMETIQFPWRFLAYASCFGYVAAMLALWALIKSCKKTTATLVVMGMILVVIVLSMPLFETLISDSETNYRNSSWVMNTDGDNLYLTDVARDIQFWEKYPFYVCEDDSFVFASCNREALTLTFTFENPTGSAQTIIAPLYNYPNSYVSLDNSTMLLVESSGLGYVQFVIPEGVTEGSVTVGFQTFTYYYVGYGVTIATLIFCMGWVVFSKRKKG